MPIHTLALSDELNLPLCSSPLGLAVTHGRAHHQNFLAVTYSDAVFVRKLTNYVGKEPHEEMDELRARLMLLLPYDSHKLTRQLQPRTRRLDVITGI